MVQKGCLWLIFPLSIAICFGLVWVVGNFGLDTCHAWFDYGPSGSPRRLGQIWCWPIVIIAGIALLVFIFVLMGLLYLLFRLILRPLGLWDDRNV